MTSETSPTFMRKTSASSDSAKLQSQHRPMHGLCSSRQSIHQLLLGALQLLPTGHKTQNQFVGDQAAHQPLRILEIMLTPTGRTVGKRLRQVQTHVGLQFRPHRPPVLGSRHHHLFYSCSRNHVKRWCSSLGMVTNRRRAGFSSGLLASTTITIRAFLCTSIPATFIASASRGSGRTHAKKVTHRHVLPLLPLAAVARHRLVRNPRSGSNSKTASLHPECKQTFAVHAPSAYTPLNPIFMSMGGPQAHA
jgi:hypothetical protein